MFFTLMRRSFVVSWPYLLGLMFVFTVTLSIFPAVTVSNIDINFLSFIQDPNLRAAWALQILVIIFNIGDTLSRYVSNQSWGNAGPKLTLFLTYSGFIFIVSSFIIALKYGPSWLTTGTGGDIFKITNISIFSFWNGYCAAQCAVKAPSRAPSYLKETVGNFVGTFVPLGLMIGSLISIPF